MRGGYQSGFSVFSEPPKIVEQLSWGFISNEKKQAQENNLVDLRHSSVGEMHAGGHRKVITLSPFGDHSGGSI
ncbi:hypothetical protein [Persicobacter psychrovividus]|uniref:hypothetical protein n=1 Tax=Persicobacter psychrovividus TaxID=387638 RepID=UPI0030CA3217